MSFRWVYAEPERKEAISTLQQELGISPKIAKLLALRGIDSYEKAKNFFRPDLTATHDPFLMQDMDKGSKRLAKAIREGQRILVYGDYDVDGTTSASILYIFLSRFCDHVDYYIPHRFKDGYGINDRGISHAVETNVDLIVSVDCGITAIDETERIKEHGIDLIICDHHNVGDKIPDATAVLDPKRDDCDYPFKGLSGAGVGFKLVQATIKKLGLSQELAYELLDLLAISIASDIVPIEDENRILMAEGLKQINNNPRPAVQALLDIINKDPGNITTSNIVFSLGPRINAAGRMGDAKKAVRLLIADTDSEATSRAHELESINIERREKDTETMEEAQAIIDKELDLQNSSSLVLHQPNWHLGVIGIVASRLVDTYCRPVVMLSTVNGKVKGSARSIKGFNIYDAFCECDDLLEQYGGHEFAAGMTIDSNNLTEFRDRMNNIASDWLTDDDFTPDLRIDGDLALTDVNMKFWKLLSQFEPFGPSNQRPVFASRDIDVVGVPTVVGQGHLKMKVSQKGAETFDVIGFNMHEYLPVMRDDDHKIDIAYSLEENNWRGRCSLQIRLRDVQLREK